ncbi:uncharacterized protein KY384_007626 [Bacidia gigantensis]|uniref:uncharacterized protein n=1 Tax=Bacidia gigantensis TaxID=2732470 RepID=UPI001D057A28|nr:uncharacterized protein KY384_007626 [Bacidia gigantensis]KAG8527474.1 hypothetical protein KY384_007626 [Bacidia gigantensis]
MSHPLMACQMVLWGCQQQLRAIDEIKGCDDHGKQPPLYSAMFANILQGGTSGIGAAVAQDLASRGAQIIILTHHELTDPFLVDYLEDIRSSSNNELFRYQMGRQCSPRRLDMIVLCADTLTPRFGILAKTQDNVDPVWAVNYLANFHLLSILNPAIKAQPPDRDVRVVFATCSSYIGGDIKSLKDDRDPLPNGTKYETSKLASMVFALAFQKLLDKHKRPDNQPNNTRVILVDPGFTRTPGMRRWLTMGSLLGLFLYLVTLPFWWLVLKSPIQGAQGFLKAAMEADLGRGVGGRLLKECRDIEYRRPEIKDEQVQRRLWQFSEKQIEALEKEGAVRRALGKKEKEGREKLESQATTDVPSNVTEANANGHAVAAELAKAERKPRSRQSRKAG